MQLDFDLDLDERLALVRSLPLDSYTPQQLELIANYILYKDLNSTKQPSKYTSSKTQPLPDTDIQTATATYTKPKPILHTEDPIIQQYLTTISTIKQLLSQNSAATHAWKLRKLKIELNLDMGLVNSLLYPHITTHPTYSISPPIDLDEYVDLTNSFHICKLIQMWSQLRLSDESKLWLEWVDQFIINKAPLKDWQYHLLRRRMQGEKQIVIAKELKQKFNKSFTPSTMSQAMRVIYRQIAATAEREIYAYYMRPYPAAWRKCGKCGELKLVSIDFYQGKNTCKQCMKERYHSGKNL